MQCKAPLLSVVFVVLNQSVKQLGLLRLWHLRKYANNYKSVQKCAYVGVDATMRL